MFESVMTVRFAAGVNLCSSTAIPYYRPVCGPEDLMRVFNVKPRRLSHSSGFDVPWRSSKCRRSNSSSLKRRNILLKSRVRACTKQLGSGSDPIKDNGRTHYHPFEETAKLTAENNGDATLNPAETSRTVIEVNSKATVMLSNLINDEVHENIIWPDLPYVTDEHGNIYFQVKKGEDTKQTLCSEDNFVQVIIGLDTTEMLSELDLSGPSEISFGIEDIEDADSDFDDEEVGEDDDEDDNGDDDTDWVAVLDNEDNGYDSDKSLGDWAKLETMRSSHPMFFAKKMAEVASDDPTDWMDQPPASLSIQGVLRPAFIDEHSVIHKHLKDHEGSGANINQVGEVVEDNSLGRVSINGYEYESASSKDSSSWEEELEKEEILSNGITFYKLEMIKIQLFSAHGLQTAVEIGDYMKAQPDAITHSAAKILSRLKEGGEKTTQALKSLCWRLKGIQVEEAVLIGVDSLGFDLRVCSGTQVQTLRFAFDSRATSEYRAERQLNDLLFPRIHPKPQRVKQTRQSEP